MKNLILLFLILSTLSFSLDKVILTSGEWEPFASSKNKDARIGEILVEEAFKNVGIDVEFAYFPWKRSYLFAERGEYDGSVLWVASEERKKEVLFSDEYIVKVNIVFFHRSDFNFDWKSIEDLKKYKVGGTLGYSEAKALMDQGIDVEIANSEETNFKKLLAGRIDVYSASFITGYSIIKNLFNQKEKGMITTHPVPRTSYNMYMFVSKNHPKRDEILSSFNKGMKMLKESNRYDELLNKALGLE